MVKTIFPFIYILFLFILPAGAVYSQQRAEASGKEPPSQALFLYLNRGDGEPNEVKKLIEQGADVNYKDEQYLIAPLHNVSHYGHIDAAKGSQRVRSLILMFRNYQKARLDPRTLYLLHHPQNHLLKLSSFKHSQKRRGWN